MGPADRVPFGSAGAEIVQRADRNEAHERFTQVRAARMRKTLLLLVVCIEFLLGSAECYSTPQQLTRPSLSVLFLRIS